VSAAGGAPDRPRRLRLGALLASGVALSALLAVVGLSLGSAELGAGAIARVLAAHLLPAGSAAGGDLAIDPVADAIVWSLRLPRVLLAMLVGASLAIAGALMQGLFRNALASPGIVGTSAGASLGAICALAFGLADQSVLALPALAIGGALAALLVVQAIATRDGSSPAATLLLAGVALTAFIGAINAWIIASSWEEHEVARRISYWLLGGLSDRGWIHVAIVAPCLLGAGIVAWWLGRDLDLLLEGEEVASALGVEVERTRRVLLAASAVLAGAAVAVSGVVAFVGLVVPHVVRLLLGPAHRTLLVAGAVTGAWFVLGADLVARTVVAPQELQLGVVTAFVGAPFFLFLLVRHRWEIGE